MDGFLSALGVTLPVLAAPMAGGPSTPAMVTEAARAGGLGFLAGGYKTVDALAAEIAGVRGVENATPFGVNLFVPNPVAVDEDAYRRYRRALQPVAELLGVDLAAIAPTEDDDHWSAKIELLLADPVPAVSFTFGLPERSVSAALKSAGSLVMQSVTTIDEARAAAEIGADALIVQASAAGGHSATFNPARPPVDVELNDLVGEIVSEISLPVIAAGGVATPQQAAAALTAGATAVMVGTALLLSDESGASQPHRVALQGHRDTVVTCAFTGRPARALRNEFTNRFSRLAPPGYPALHHLTSPLRKAAVATGDPEMINLWAGTGYRHAMTAATYDIVSNLASESG